MIAIKNCWIIKEERFELTAWYILVRCRRKAFSLLPSAAFAEKKAEHFSPQTANMCHKLLNMCQFSYLWRILFVYLNSTFSPYFRHLDTSLRRLSFHNECKFFFFEVLLLRIRPLFAGSTFECLPNMSTCGSHFNTFTLFRLIFSSVVFSLILSEYNSPFSKQSF